MNDSDLRVRVPSAVKQWLIREAQAQFGSPRQMSLVIRKMIDAKMKREGEKRSDPQRKPPARV